MGGVLGVSVGAGFVRLARPLKGSGGFGDTAVGDSAVFEHQAIEVAGQVPEVLAAQVVGVVLADRAESGSATGVAITYRDEAQAAAIDAALSRQGVDHFLLVPELTAVLEQLHRSGVVAEYRTLVLYDVGSSGLMISVVERLTGVVAASERIDFLRGGDPGGHPRETFDGITVPAIEESVCLVAELIEQSGRSADALVLLGGGAVHPTLRDALHGSLGLPVVTPPNPELVAAHGAALLARPPASPAATARGGRSAPATARRLRSASSTRARRTVSRRQIVGAVLAGAALVVIAAIGIGLGYGDSIFGQVQVPPTSLPAGP
ncbi:hypothetical protein ERC79_08305 [Rhodococcus sp. ABRD24]|uniref:hypothetical protein n=1 Tax=Rhodococcus sp. ABRD24 TaxID=2507582 RepID=UPI00103BB651|nr:hypothetical protein [Rhodococcus sp. ABRD24]QBJ95974.1 hypothetical protein ERC79_08305 [Rhodococcus sp. ABRD24]